MYKTHIVIFAWEVPDETDFTVIKPKLLQEVTYKIKPPPTENVAYYGTYTYVPKEHHPAYEKFLNHLEEKMNISKIITEHDSVGLIVNNVVLYLDLPNNFENFDSHPYTSIGKMYMLRQFLSELFPDVTYLNQSMKWVREATEKYTEKYMHRMNAEVNLKLLELLARYKHEEDSHRNCNHGDDEPCCSGHHHDEDENKKEDK